MSPNTRKQAALRRCEKAIGHEMPRHILTLFTLMRIQDIEDIAEWFESIKAKEPR